MDAFPSWRASIVKFAVHTRMGHPFSCWSRQITYQTLLICLIVWTPIQNLHQRAITLLLARLS